MNKMNITEKQEFENKKKSLLNIVRKKQRQLESDWSLIDVYGIQLKSLYNNKEISLDEAWKRHNDQRKVDLSGTHLILCSDEELLKELKNRINDKSIELVGTCDLNGNDLIIDALISDGKLLYLTRLRDTKSLFFKHF